MLEIKINEKVFAMFLEITPVGKQFVVYMNTRNGWVLYNTIAEEIKEYGCNDNEVITLQPKREAVFINLLLEKGIISPSNRYIEGKYEKQPIYSINYEKAEKIGLSIVTETAIIEWKYEMNRI